MPLRFFNTRTRTVETFEAIAAPKVGLYTCGPTVYNYAHIGNFRTYLFEDLLRRCLNEAGFQVTHVCNITDVGHLTSDADNGEDKMEKGAAREGKSVWDIAAHYTVAFQEDLQRLNILSATHWPKATDHIPEQIAMVQGLIEKGFAYLIDDGVYFDVARFPRYGDFARMDLCGQEAGARVAVSGGKRNPQDFALWKLSPPGSQRLMEWDSPWGKGFPGWHIECSAMSLKYLGEHFDIHCGGIDHIPVHHTNEIAQSEAYLGIDPWVNVWIHGEFLITDAGKMSKSSGEFLSLSKLTELGYDPLDYRFFCLQAHYRQGLNFSFEALDAAKVGRRRLMERIEALPGDEVLAATEAKVLEPWAKFWEALSDDLNAPRALAVVFDVLKQDELSGDKKRGLLKAMDECLGLKLFEKKAPADSLSAELQALIDERGAARQAREWKRADELRDLLKAKGIEVLDAKQGQVWKKI